MEERKALALFDFDGTLTRKDTLFEMALFDKGWIAFIWGMFILLPQFLLYYLGQINAQKLKEKYLQHFFKNRDLDNWNDTCEKFSEKVLPGLIRKNALDCLLKHKSENARILVVTASCENWVSPWCRKLGIECISSEMEVFNNRITGSLLGPNCNGIEKVNRIRQYLKIETYSPIFAYGDTKGDYEMLKLADHAFLKSF